MGLAFEYPIKHVLRHATFFSMPLSPRIGKGSSLPGCIVCLQLPSTVTRMGGVTGDY